MTEDEQTHRDNVALALRQVADRICDNPDWPVETYPKIHISAARAEQGGIDEVDRAAAAFGVQPHWEANGDHYTAETKVGPIKVSITAIKNQHMTNYVAAQKVADEWLEEQRAADPNTSTGSPDPHSTPQPQPEGEDAMGKKVTNIAGDGDNIGFQAGFITIGGKPAKAPKPAKDTEVKVTNVRKGNAKVGHQTDGTVHL